MGVCTSGVPQPRSGIPDTVIINGDKLREIAEQYIPWIGPFIAPVPTIVIDTASFCAAEPPGNPTFTKDDLITLVTGGRIGLFQVAAEKVEQAARQWAWYQLCECSSAPQPTIPSAPAEPSDTPVIGFDVYGRNPYVAAVLADSPSHYWRLADPGGGMIARDLVGGMDLIAPFNYCVEFGYTGPISDGGSVLVATNPGIRNRGPIAYQTPLTMECWLWIASTNNSDNITTAVMQHDPNDTIQRGLSLNSAGVVRFNTVNASPASSGLSAQAWHHIVAVDNPPNATLYVDGAQVATQSTSQNNPLTNAPFRIGGSVGGSPFFVIAEAALYPTALSSTRIGVHYVAADNATFRPSWSGGLPKLPSLPQSSSQQDLLSLLTLIQRQGVPFAYIPGDSHTGLTGDGEIAVAGLLGVAVDLTTIPSNYGSSDGTPVHLVDVGFLTLGSADGWLTSQRIASDGAVVLPGSFAGVLTRVGYTLRPGVVATITELIRES